MGYLLFFAGVISGIIAVATFFFFSVGRGKELDIATHGDIQDINDRLDKMLARLPKREESPE
jgi:hypothetical protein